MQSKKLLKILVITQARFSSNRLPGKILLDLGGKKALEQVFIRLKNIDIASNVVCAGVVVAKNPLQFQRAVS